MDSWEKIEQELERHLAEYGDPEPEGYPIAEQVIQWALAALRALRERDEKRWEIVREVGGALHIAGSQTLNDEFHALADRLREAREGRDA